MKSLVTNILADSDVKQNTDVNEVGHGKPLDTFSVDKNDGSYRKKSDSLEKWTPQSATENLSAVASSLKKDCLEKWTPRRHQQKSE
jgi:hypothetical protein